MAVDYKKAAKKLKRRGAANKGWVTRRAKLADASVINEEQSYHWHRVEEVPPSLPLNGASVLLTEASGIVAGARNTTHGEKERSFTAIADLWNTYVRSRAIPDGCPHDLTPTDVANMMVLLKIARSIQGTPIRDHYIDAAGYSAIAGEIALAGQK